MAHLSEEEMYAAVVGNDAAFDGVFFYAVKTTGIVCRPSCKSKSPCRDNVRFFDILEEAIQLGYRPCKRCRPDIGVGYAPEVDTVSTACEIIEREFADPDLLPKLPAMIGISTSQLRRLFRAVTGETPRVYLQRVRIAKAIELIEQQSMCVIDISLSVGFRCLSSYYSAFQSVTGQSMKEYRHAGDLHGDGR